MGIDFNSSMLQYAANRVRELTLSDRVNCSIEVITETSKKMDVPSERCNMIHMS